MKSVHCWLAVLTKVRRDFCFLSGLGEEDAAKIL